MTETQQIVKEFLNKCGIVFADLEKKLVNEAIVIKTETLSSYIKNIFQNQYDLIILFGNGTSSKTLINLLSGFEYRIIIVEEKNSTYRAKNHEKGIIWNDKDLNLKLPIKKPLISKKDKLNITFKDFLKKYKHI